MRQLPFRGPESLLPAMLAISVQVTAQDCQTHRHYEIDSARYDRSLDCLWIEGHWRDTTTCLDPCGRPIEQQPWIQNTGGVFYRFQAGGSAGGCNQPGWGMLPEGFFQDWQFAYFTLAPGCGEWGGYNFPLTSRSGLPFEVRFPAIQPGVTSVASVDCGDRSSARRTRIETHPPLYQGGSGAGYNIRGKRTVHLSGPGGETPGSQASFALGLNESATFGPCSSRTLAVYTVEEYCGNHRFNTSTKIREEGTPYGEGAQPIRDYIRARPVRYFRVRSPSAVMGVRGFAAAETVLQGLVDDPAASVRWQRLRDDAEPDSNGILPIELLEDGPLPGGGSLTGAHTATLRMTGFGDHDAGTYLMLVIPPGGTVNDATVAADIRVVDNTGQPFFANEPAPATVCADGITAGGIALTATASSSAPGPIQYSWYINGKLATSLSPYVNDAGDRIQVYQAATETLTIGAFAPGSGTPHNVAFWVECEASNEHGSVRTRAIPLVIDIDSADCDADGTTDACEIASGAADANDDGIPDGCQCLADVDGNHAVDGADLGMLLSQWGTIQPNGTSLRCDLNADGRVDGADLGVLLSGWGTCGN